MTEPTADSTIRIAIIGPSGSGKSSTAGALAECFRANGLRVGIYKLAEPLYRLQEQFYDAAGRTLTPGAQDQALLETIASRLRAISPTALVDDLKARLATAEEDVIINDDLRDDRVDWQVLRQLGFSILRVVTPQSTRLERLTHRGDPSIVGHSVLDEQIARIPADFAMPNRKDGVGVLHEQVRIIADHLMHGHRPILNKPRHAIEHVIRLTTGAVPIDLIAKAGTARIAETLCAHLAPTFSVRLEGSPIFTLVLKPFSELKKENAAVAAKDFALRRSSARPFNLDLRIGRDSNGSVIGLDDDTGTAYLYKPRVDRLTMFVGDGSLFHLLETIRYTALAAEQRKGSAILHASAVIGPRGAILMMGDKGTGKTTLLFSLMMHHGLRYFSGDKVLIDNIGGRLRLRGWPDYPHVGFGTLRRFPALATACGIDLTDPATDDSHKILIEPASFLAAVGGITEISKDRCDMLLFPNVQAKSNGIISVTDRGHRLALLEMAIEDAGDFLPGQWHGLMPAGAVRDASDLLDYFDSSRWYLVNGKSNDLSVLL